MLLDIGIRGADGRSAWERIKGRKFVRELPEFAERILYLNPSSAGEEKLNSRWESGRFIGLQGDVVHVPCTLVH